MLVSSLEILGLLRFLIIRKKRISEKKMQKNDGLYFFISVFFLILEIPGVFNISTMVMGDSDVFTFPVVNSGHLPGLPKFKEMVMDCIDFKYEA